MTAILKRRFEWRYTLATRTTEVLHVEKPGKSISGRQIGIAVVTVLVLLVIWQNSESTALSILFFSVNLPLMVWLAAFLAVGFLLGVAVMWSYRRRQ